MRFNRKIYIRFVLSLFIVLGASLSVSAEKSEDEGWFWGKTISEITFDGLKNVKRSELAGITNGFIGRPFTEEVYTDLSDRLYSLDMFDDITPFAKHDPKTADKILLVFQVKERPVVQSIRFSGNSKIRNGELRDAVAVKTGDIFVESKVLLDERALRDVYLKKGYTDATISHTVEEMSDGIRVTFVINEGASTVISAIRFSGNTLVSDRTLKSK